MRFPGRAAREKSDVIVAIAWARWANRAADDAIVYSHEEVLVFNSEPTVPFFCEVFKMKDACVLLRIVIERAFRQRFFADAIVIGNHERCLRRTQPAEQNAFGPARQGAGGQEQKCREDRKKAALHDPEIVTQSGRFIGPVMRAGPAAFRSNLRRRHSGRIEHFPYFDRQRLGLKGLLDHVLLAVAESA